MRYRWLSGGASPHQGSFTIQTREFNTLRSLFPKGERLKEVGITSSMGRTGPALDNALAKSFVSTLKGELVSRLRFPSRQAARTAIFDYLEALYDTRRLHSSLDYRSPQDFEEDRIEEASVA
jgi:transposase InsO family protein